MNHCQKKCLGWEGNHGGCCTVHDRDYIIGPINDSHDFLARLKNKYPGIELEWKDVFITYEEGSKMFPEKPTWQDPKNFPCLRLDVNIPLMPCMFYNLVMKCCTVYDIRPTTCRTFLCEYLKNLPKQE